MRIIERGFVPGQKQDFVKVARERWDVDLNDDRAVLNKLQSFQGKMPDVADLSNLWLDLQKQKEKKEKDEVEKAA